MTSPKGVSGRRLRRQSPTLRRHQRDREIAAREWHLERFGIQRVTDVDDEIDKWLRSRRDYINRTRNRDHRIFHYDDSTQTNDDDQQRAPIVWRSTTDGQ